MFRHVLARIGFRGVILAAALGVAVAGCSSASSSSSSPAPASSAPALASSAPAPASSAPAPAAAGNGTCTTTISNQTVGNVFVPAGQTCTLNNVTVHGNITDYGYLQLTTSADIGGNVVVEFGSTIIESGPTTVAVDGNLTVNGAFKSSFTSDFVRGNLTQEHLDNAYSTDSHIGGSIIWLDNGAGSLIGGDTVGGNIICSGNATPPTNGGTPNKVHGHETGQCAHLH